VGQEGDNHPPGRKAGSMIGIDTNLLLRLWLNDAPAQNKHIDMLLGEYGRQPSSLLITDVVLAEAL
jgi:predicted nucleic-acid-binding protein